MSRAHSPNSPNPAAIPADFPHPHRSGGGKLFRHLLNDAPESTFCRWIAEGRIKKPVKLGGLSAWPETYMAEVAANGTAPAGTY